MCSSDFGPARLPSLVTWPMRKVVIPLPLATKRSWVATSRTWLMLPGAEANLDEKTVWTESTTSAAGFSSSTWSRMRSSEVSAIRKSPPPWMPRRSPRILICRSDSSPET
jgi:hypothetical protein